MLRDYTNEELLGITLYLAKINPLIVVLGKEEKEDFNDFAGVILNWFGTEKVKNNISLYILRNSDVVQIINDKGIDEVDRLINVGVEYLRKVGEIP